MSRAIREVRDLLGPDPMAHQHSLVSADQRREDLQQILVTTPAGQRPATHPARPRRRLVLAAGAGAVALAGVAAIAGVNLLSPVTHDGYAVTPVPLAYQQAAHPAEPAATMLNRIAAQAAQLPAPAPAGRYQHLTATSWNLTTRIYKNRPVQSAVVPEQRETWRGPDRSGTVTVSFKAPVFQSQAQRRQWQDEGSPGADIGPRTDVYGPGKLGVMWTGAAPDDPAMLAPWLQKGHPSANGPAETLVAVSDLTAEQVLSPAQRAAVLRVLATTPGLSYTGQTTDRAGRAGEAFSVESGYSGLPTRYTVIIDPTNGALLDYEETLTTTAGALNVKVPAVISYQTYLHAGYSAKPGR
jgi:hypothetical protein